jgi:hypothetical protein
MKMLKTMMTAMVCALLGTVFVDAKIYDLSKSDCKKYSHEWRNGQCHDKVKYIKTPVTGSDASTTSKSIIVNYTTTPANAATITFYNKGKKAITEPTTIFYGGNFIEIPTNAAFVDAFYVPSNDNNDHVAILKMMPIDSSKSYSLIDPNSTNEPGDGTPWVLTAFTKSTRTPVDQPVSVHAIMGGKLSGPIMGGSSNTYAPQVFNPTSPYNGAGLVGNYFSSNGIATIHDPSGHNDVGYSFENVQGVSGNVRPVGLIEIGSFKDPNFKPSLVYCSGCPNGTIKLFGSLMQEDDAA